MIVFIKNLRNKETAIDWSLDDLEDVVLREVIKPQKENPCGFPFT